MLSLFAASALARFASGSVDPVVEPLKKAASRLGDALGRPVEVEHSLAGIPVLVDAVGADANEALRTLAFGLHASLVLDGKALRIERTAADRRAVVASHRAVVRARIVAGLAAWDEALKRTESFGDVAAQVKAARSRRDAALREQREALRAGRSFTSPSDLVFPELLTPAARLLRGIMDRLGPDRLAALAPGEIRFLSDRPNAFEAPLPNCGDLVDAYLRTQIGYAKSMGVPEPAGRFAKIVLTLKEWGGSLDLYDAGGKRTDRGAMSYSGTGVFYSPPPGPPAAATPALAPLGESTRRLARVFSPPDGHPIRRGGASLPEEYLHPERFDPLDFEVRTGMLALPRTQGTSGMVAVLSDRLLNWVGQCVKNDRLDTTAFAWRLEHEGGYERNVEHGTLVIRPKDALDFELGTADRDLLGREVRRVVADREVDLRNWTELRLALYNGLDQPATERYLWPLPWLILSTNLEVLNHGSGDWALLGAAIQAGRTTADGGAPPFDGLIRNGIVQGWLHFVGSPSASDLDLAPSSLLAELRNARVVSSHKETLVAKSYGGFDGTNTPVKLEYEDLDVDRLRGGFADAQEPAALGAGEAGSRTWRVGQGMVVRPDERPLVDARIHGLHYLLGRRIALGVDVVLEGGVHAHIQTQDWEVDRHGRAFADLPLAFQEEVLRGARQILDASPNVPG